MWHNPLLAASGQDLMPLVIIIVVIIAQLIKAAKGQKPTIGQPGHQPSGEGIPAEPEDELKKFLESLSGGNSSPAEEKPLPPPVPRHKPRTLSPGKTPRPLAPKTARIEQVNYEVLTPDQPLEVKIPPPPLSEPLPGPPKSDIKSQSSPIRIPVQTNPLRSQIVCELKAGQSIKKAIILREILGPCHAVRQYQSLSQMVS